MAPVTAEPGTTSTGTGSPVSSDASTADVPDDDHAVGGHLLSRTDDEEVVDLEPVGRHPLLGAARERPASR